MKFFRRFFLERTIRSALVNCGEWWDGHNTARMSGGVVVYREGGLFDHQDHVFESLRQMAEWVVIQRHKHAAWMRERAAERRRAVTVLAQ